MPRLIEKLTPLAVSRAKRPGYYGDGAGLWLQISTAGTKSWIFRFTLRGKPREMGLGPLHTVSLADARVKAKACRQQLLDGIDPIAARDAAKKTHALEQARAMTFDQCAAAYIKAHRNGWRNPKHAAQWESTIASYASPVFGELPVAAVDTALVMKALNPIWGEKTETASRLRGRIESVLGWATTSGYRQGDNPARWRGHLENLLAAPEKVRKVEHHPALPWQRMGAFMAALRAREGISARAVEFAILCAARSGEVRGMRWAEVDGGVWTIPADRMKAGREHRIPLSSAALSLLTQSPRVSDYVFPGARQGSLLSDMSLTAVLRRMNSDGMEWVSEKGDPITVHGFRSTFRDWASETTNFPREVCEHALAHQLPDKVEAAYRRGDLIEKRKLLMEAWSNFCAANVESAEVLPIRSAA